RRHSRLLAGGHLDVLGSPGGRASSADALRTILSNHTRQDCRRRTLVNPLRLGGHFHFASLARYPASHWHSRRNRTHELQTFFALHDPWLRHLVCCPLLCRRQNGARRTIDERRVAPHLTLARRRDARIRSHVLHFCPSPHAQ